MIYRLYKKFAVVLIVFVSFTVASISVFNEFLPERLYSDGNRISIASSYGKFITFEENNETSRTVFNEQNDSYKATAKLLGVFPVRQVDITVTDEKIVKVCGTPFGIKMFTDGVLVVDFSKIDTENGRHCPAKESGLAEGDLIIEISGTSVFRNEDVAEIIENSQGKALEFLVNRNGTDITLSVTPEMLNDKSGYKAGFWVRDSSAGIGTLTFYDPENLSFAGLGHAVCDTDTGIVLPFSNGEIVEAAITKVKKGAAGAPGELSGAFTGKENLGIVKINKETGIFGTLEYEIEGIEMPIAPKQEIYEGEAVILSTLSGTKAEEYDIVIEKVSLSDSSNTKNMIIRVVDEELLELTGGIVQGMSGSPIIQDGKLVGAVTHVFVNDPTKGFGIFIENMLETAG